MAEDPPAQETTPVEPESPAEDPALTGAQARSLASRQRRQARFEEAVRLREQGLSMRATARTLGIERKTVRRWLRAGQAPTWRRAHRGRSILDPFRPYLDRRWNEGCHNAAALWRELHEQGFPGGPSIVRQWATCQRQTEPAAAHPRPRVAPPPTSRKAARMLMADPDTLSNDLSNDDRRFVAVLRERSAPIARAADLMQRYAALVKGGSAGPLDGWITEAEVGGFPGFAASLRQDYDAVQTALSEPWSTGQVEGQINRLKVIKRAMYGRAGFELLRSRVLAAA
jgi:transposase